MKHVLILFLITSTLSLAESKKPALKVFRQVSQDSSACRKKVETLIRSTARSMGLQQKFGIPDITQARAGNDATGNPLVGYSTGVFIIEDGYISHSGATVTVRPENCEIIKLEISIGG